MTFNLLLFPFKTKPPKVKSIVKEITNWLIPRNKPADTTPLNGDATQAGGGRTGNRLIAWALGPLVEGTTERTRSRWVVPFLFLFTD